MATSTAAVVDLSLPVADILRKGTSAAHERAEHSQGAKWLARGELDKEEYVRFLMMVYHVYDAFERALEQHATHPVLAPTHNPGLFARTASIAADISYLLGVPESSWQTHPLHVALQTAPPAALTQYVSRIRELAAGPDPSRLLAHAYVRYLGDLSGGQFIRRRIVKAYGLEDGAGVSFYEFRPLGGASSASAGTMGDLKKIKDWYREGMNAGVGDSTELKAEILDEAELAFDYNTAIFDALHAPSTTSSSSSSSDVEIDSPLHSPVESSPPSPPATDLEPKVVFQASQPPSDEPLVSLSSVIALVIALSLTHFTLVVGGFTGARGLYKLDKFQEWLNGVFATIWG